MESKIEILEKNLAKITLHIPADRFEEGMKFSYNKNKNKLKLPGFRTGRVPRSLAEKQYGSEIFFDDAIEYCFPEAYEKAIDELGFNPVSRPEMEAPEYDKETGMTVTINVWVKPEVKLGEYKGLTYDELAIDVTEEEINNVIDDELQKNSRQVSVHDRAVKDGDIVTIDYEGFFGEEPFEGGKDEDHELRIGSKTFIDTFEEQLIGKNINDFVEVFVTFPADYGKTEYQNKEAKFNVTIKDIAAVELPELNDEFAQDVSEFDTFDEYKNSIKEKLISQKEDQKELNIETQLLQKISENAECDIPPVMIDDQMGQMISEFSNRLSQQGLNLDVFLKYSGKTFSEFKEGYRPSAESNVKARLTLEAIADAENLEITDEHIDVELNRMSQAYGVDIDTLKNALSAEGKKGLITDIKTQKALNFIKEHAVKND